MCVWGGVCVCGGGGEGGGGGAEGGPYSKFCLLHRLGPTI